MQWDRDDSQQMRELIDRFEANASPDFRMRVLQQVQQRPKYGWIAPRWCGWYPMSRVAVGAAVLVLLLWMMPSDWPLKQRLVQHPPYVAQQLGGQKTSSQELNAQALREAPLPAPAVAFTTGAPLTRLVQVGLDVLFNHWFREDVKDTPWKQESVGPHGKQG